MPRNFIKGWFEKRFVQPKVQAAVTQTEERMKASIPIAMLSDEKDIGWRRITQDNIRDLDPMTRYQQIRVVEYLGVANPLAKFILDVSTDFVCGKGFTLSSPVDKTREWLEEFWRVNKLDEDIYRNAMSLSQYGELVLPAFVNKFTGRVRLGFIDPMILSDVVGDPANPRVAIGVVLMGKADGRQITLRTILTADDEEGLSPEAQTLRESYTDGACFFFAINEPGPSCRGISDLFPLADWLDAYDTALWTEAERQDLMKDFVWDVTLNGADKPQVEAYAKDIATPKGGSVRVHNENVKWEAVTPDLKATDTSEAMRTFRNHILGGAHIPEHWFGGGGKVNKATAAEMDTPTMMYYIARQGKILNLVYALCNFAVSQGIEHGLLPDSDDSWNFSVDTPELATKDISAIAAALQQVTTSLQIAKTMNIIDSKSASRVFCQFVTQTGTEVDPDEAYQAAQVEKENESYQDYGAGKNAASQGTPQVADATLKAARRRGSGRRPVYKRL